MITPPVRARGFSGSATVSREGGALISALVPRSARMNAMSRRMNPIWRRMNPISHRMNPISRRMNAIWRCMNAISRRMNPPWRQSRWRYIYASRRGTSAESSFARVGLPEAGLQVTGAATRR
jgi:hypothetical protein